MRINYVIVLTSMITLSTNVSGFSPNVLSSRPSNKHSLPTHPNHERKTIALQMSASAAMPDGSNDWEKDRSQSKETDVSKSPETTTNFLPLESHPPSPQRLSRIDRETDTKSKFLHGDELINLRKYINNLEVDLQFAREKHDAERIIDLTQALHESNNLDAEYVYTNCMEMAEASESKDEAKEWIRDANEAKECLPQFNLQGLWVGK